jgi:hypothetical protein
MKARMYIGMRSYICGDSLVVCVVGFTNLIGVVTGAWRQRLTLSMGPN